MTTVEVVDRTPPHIQEALNTLVGRTIVDAFYMQDEDPHLTLQLDDGSVLLVLSDEEGNGYGALFRMDPASKYPNPSLIPGCLE